MRFIFSSVLLMISQLALCQNTESYGVYVGLNIPFTVDQGLYKDPRFVPKGVVRGTPIGFYYGYDKSGYGFALTPAYIRLGQTYKIKNTTGGDVGFRYVHTNYFTVPIALKIHINDLSFFRLSLVASLSPSLLLKGQETISHDASKLKYPSGVSVPTETGYTISYDGVFVPKVVNEVYVSQDKFSIFQLFGSLGVRSDFDLSDNWSINYDGRINFGIFDSRKTSYLKTLKTPSGAPDFYGNPGAPDIYGPRRDVYISLEIGFCRIIQTKEKFKTKQSGKSITVPRDIPKPRNKKPKR